MFSMNVSDKLDESLRCHADLGFAPVFYSDRHLHLKRTESTPIEPGFLQPEHETRPAPFRPRFDGNRLCFGFTVEGVDQAHSELAAAGHDIVVNLRREPWSQRDFAIPDPNGVGLDIIGEIEPDATLLAVQTDLIPEPARKIVT